MNTVNIGKLPVKVTEIGFGYAIVDIGDISTQIIEPKPSLLRQGLVYLSSNDPRKANWQALIACELNGRKLPGFSADPRLLEIASLVFQAELTEKDVGKVFPPRE